MQRSVATTIRSGRKAKLASGGMETVRSTTGALRLQPGTGTASDPGQVRKQDIKIAGRA